MPHRVYMRFEQATLGWNVEFLSTDLKTAVGRRLFFTQTSKIKEMAERGGADSSLATKQGIDQGIKSGRGGVFLNLTDEQMKRMT